MGKRIIIVSVVAFIGFPAWADHNNNSGMAVDTTEWVTSANQAVGGTIVTVPANLKKGIGVGLVERGPASKVSPPGTNVGVSQTAINKDAPPGSGGDTTGRIAVINTGVSAHGSKEHCKPFPDPKIKGVLDCVFPNGYNVQLQPTKLKPDPKALFQQAANGALVEAGRLWPNGSINKVQVFNVLTAGATLGLTGATIATAAWYASTRDKINEGPAAMLADASINQWQFLKVGNEMELEFGNGGANGAKGAPAGTVAP